MKFPLDWMFMLQHRFEWINYSTNQFHAHSINKGKSCLILYFLPERFRIKEREISKWIDFAYWEWGGVDACKKISYTSFHFQFQPISLHVKAKEMRINNYQSALYFLLWDSLQSFCVQNKIDSSSPQRAAINPIFFNFHFKSLNVNRSHNFSLFRSIPPRHVNFHVSWFEIFFLIFLSAEHRNLINWTRCAPSENRQHFSNIFLLASLV